MKWPTRAGRPWVIEGYPIAGIVLLEILKKKPRPNAGVNYLGPGCTKSGLEGQQTDSNHRLMYTSACASPQK
jgi:hypothetical protein